ncbi:hypothetical protein CH254_21010 [Rhodococcus sp. 06-412-2C]|nr:hypothetical protein CH254_21010 [Rhodococcus sp. 06-412-2C]OZC98514.1 hypothetical protein CH279_13655 [Rhodococcus sp. 06-412-2B]
MAARDLVTSTKPIEEIFAEQLKFEHDLVAHRMGWLMTLNGFLIGGTAVLLANRDKFRSGDEAVFFAAVVTIGLLGVLCNVSSLYSNRWASKAIHEAGRALASAWTSARLNPEQIATRTSMMRLYGRDPQSLTSRRPPRSEMLHPWMLIPAVFAIVYAAMPYLTSGMSPGSEVLWIVLRWLPAFFALLLPATGWLLDRLT